MKTFALAAVAAALFTMPAVANDSAARTDTFRLAQADINVRIGGDGVRVGPRRNYHHRDRHYYRGHRDYRGHRASCRTVVVKERRGHTVVTKRIRRC